MCLNLIPMIILKSSLHVLSISFMYPFTFSGAAAIAMTVHLKSPWEYAVIIDSEENVCVILMSWLVDNNLMFLYPDNKSANKIYNYLRQGKEPKTDWSRYSVQKLCGFACKYGRLYYTDTFL